MSLINVNSGNQNPSDFVAKMPHSLIIEPYSQIALKTGNAKLLQRELYNIDSQNDTFLVGIGNGGFQDRDENYSRCFCPFLVKVPHGNYSFSLLHNSKTLFGALQDAINEQNPWGIAHFTIDREGLTSDIEYRIRISKMRGNTSNTSVKCVMSPFMENAENNTINNADPDYSSITGDNWCAVNSSLELVMPFDDTFTTPHAQWTIQETPTTGNWSEQKYKIRGAIFISGLQEKKNNQNWVGLNEWRYDATASTEENNPDWNVLAPIMWKIDSATNLFVVERRAIREDGTIGEVVESITCSDGTKTIADNDANPQSIIFRQSINDTTGIYTINVVGENNDGTYTIGTLNPPQDFCYSSNLTPRKFKMGLVAKYGNSIDWRLRGQTTESITNNSVNLDNGTNVYIIGKNLDDMREIYVREADSQNTLRNIPEPSLIALAKHCNMSSADIGLDIDLSIISTLTYKDDSDDAPWGITAIAGITKQTGQGETHKFIANTINVECMNLPVNSILGNNTNGKLQKVIHTQNLQGCVENLDLSFEPYEMLYLDLSNKTTMSLNSLHFRITDQSGKKLDLQGETTLCVCIKPNYEKKSYYEMKRYYEKRARLDVIEAETELANAELKDLSDLKK